MAHTINLGGKDYELSTMNLNVLERLQDRWDVDLDKVFPEMQKRLNKRGPKTLKFVISAMLIDKYPDMDEQTVGSMVDLDNAKVCTDAIVATFEG